MPTTNTAPPPASRSAVISAARAFGSSLPVAPDGQVAPASVGSSSRRVTSWARVATRSPWAAGLGRRTGRRTDSTAGPPVGARAANWTRSAPSVTLARASSAPECHHAVADSATESGSAVP